MNVWVMPAHGVVVNTFWNLAVPGLVNAATEVPPRDVELNGLLGGTRGLVGVSFSWKER